MPDNLPATRASELTISSFRLSETGLHAAGNPTFEEWVQAGEFINRSGRMVHFWIGDWLNFGEAAWGERYTQALQQTNYDYGTLRNDKWVASRIPPERRQPSLSFDHHYHVAELPADEQDELLQLAVEKKLNNEKFRKLIRERESAVGGAQSSRARDNQSDGYRLAEQIDHLAQKLDDTDPRLFAQSDIELLTERANALAESLTTFRFLLTAHETADAQP